MSIQRVGLTAPVEAENASSVTVARPAGVAERNLMLAEVWQRSSSYSTGVPTGWSLLQRGNGPTSSYNYLEVYAKVATSAEPASYQWSFPSSASRLGAGIVAYRNAAIAGSSVGSHALESTPDPAPHPAGVISLAQPVSNGVLVQFAADAFASTGASGKEGWFPDPALWGDDYTNRLQAQERTNITTSGTYTPPAVEHTDGGGTHAWVTVAVLLTDTVGPAGGLDLSLPTPALALAGGSALVGSLDLGLPVAQAVLGADVAQPATGALDLILPDPRLLLPGTVTRPHATTDTFNRANGRGRTGIGYANLDLPFATLTNQRPIRVMAQTTPEPTLRDGRPT